MNDLRFFLSFYRMELWKRRWSVLLIAWFVALMGIFAVLIWPDRYKSSAQIYVDTDALLAQILENSALPQETEQKVDNMRLLMYARPNLQRVLKNTNLDINIKNQTDEERIIEGMRKDLELQRVSDNVYRISYINSNPERARQVVQEILNSFVETSLLNTSKSSQKSITYAEGRVRDLREQLGDIQSEVAKFRPEHINELQDKAVLLNELRTAEDFLANSPSESRALETRVTSMQATLSQTPKSTSIYMGGGSGGGMVDDCGLPPMEMQLTSLLARGLTAEHPDVRMQRTLISKRRAECTPTNGGGGGGGRSVSQPNPLYLQMQDQVNGYRTQLQQIRDREDVERRNVKRIREILARQPEIIERLRILETRSETLFADLKIAENDLDKVQQTVDTNRKLTLIDYRVTEAPIAPHVPEAPNRFILFMGVFVASLSAGIGVAICQMQFQDNIPTLRHLKSSFDIPILGSVSEVRGAQRQDVHTNLSDTTWYALFALMVCLFGLLIYYYHVLLKRPDLGAIFRHMFDAIQAVI